MYVYVDSVLHVSSRSEWMCEWKNALMIGSLNGISLLASRLERGANQGASLALPGMFCVPAVALAQRHLKVWMCC